jgi:hypothetical protein
MSIKKNSIVQVNEHGQEGWVGCLVQVDEVKPWGIQGWVQIPMQGQAFIRLQNDHIDYIGEAKMIQP